MRQVAKRASVLKRRKSKNKMESSSSTPTDFANTATTTTTTESTSATMTATTTTTIDGSNDARRDSEGDLIFYIEEPKAGKILNYLPDVFET